MLVEAAYGGIAEEDAAATVGLQTMLVRVDDDGVGFADAVRKPGRIRVEIRDQLK